MKRLRSTLWICCLTAALICACSCMPNTAVVPAELATQIPTFSPVPMTPSPVPPTPEPTASPTPEPTAVPPSYFAPTTRMRFEELVGDNGNYDLPLGYPSPDTYRVVVDLYHQVVMIYERDCSGNYTVPVRYMLCSSGLRGSTPCGTFHLLRYRVRFGFFRNDKTYGQYWTLIKGRIYFHSLLYAERNADTYIESTYDALGTPDSHGCIRLTVPDARFIYYNLGYGTEVEIREGDPNDTLTASIRDSLILAERPAEHVTLVPGEIPSTDVWRIEDIPLEIPYEEGSQKKQK